MERLEINRLIKEKLDECERDTDTRGFIEDILKIEKEHLAKRGKTDEYEKALAKYVRMG